MRLYTFEINGRISYGAERNGRILDLPLAAAQQGRAVPPDLLSFVKDRKLAMLTARSLCEAAHPGPSFALADVKVRPPIPRPGKVLCSGVNYHGHFQENPKGKVPEEPFFFSKVPSAIVGHGDTILLPARSQQVDYEVEMAVVIGERLTRVSPARVREAIFGYSVFHDVSARDVQFKDAQITLGKNFDTFAPFGPCIVTADEVPHPEKLVLRTILNGQVVQESSNEDWVFPLNDLIAILSQTMTLEPGDVVSTGTPRGVGFFRDPQLFLKHGDTVVVEVEGIGRLENPVAHI